MKLNQKGFAISTILYGLLLMGILIMALLMSTASFNLTTTKDFVESVSNDLTATADASLPGGSDGITITKSYEKWEAKKTGYYKMQLCTSSVCVKGVIYLIFRQPIHFYKSGTSSIDARLEKNNTNSRIMYAGTNYSNSYISGGYSAKSLKARTGTALKSVTDNDYTLHYSGKYFINATMTSGGGVSSVSYVGTLDEVKKMQNNFLKKESKPRYVMDCATSGSRNWAEIQVFSEGKNVAVTKPVTPDLGSYINPGNNNYTPVNLTFITDNNLTNSSTSVTNNLACVIVDVGVDMDKGNDAYYNIDQIAVFGSTAGHTLSVSSDGVTFNTIANSGTMGGGLTGLIYNAYSGM